jgi:hypothetical protein
VSYPSLASHPLKSLLARRLIVAIILFSAAMVLVMTALQLYQEYRRQLHDVEAQFQQIGEVHLRSLTQSLWATNNKEVQIQLEGMLQVPNIVHAAVHEKTSCMHRLAAVIRSARSNATTRCVMNIKVGRTKSAR